MTDYIYLMHTRPELFENSEDKTSIKIITDVNEIQKLSAQWNTDIGVVYKDKYIYVLRDAVIFPDGQYGTYIRVVHVSPKAGVVLIPVYNNKILFIRHYRHALRKYMWELPRGFMEENLSVEENASKELWEECNLSCESCDILGQITADSGIMSGEPYVVLAHTTSDVTLTNDAAEGISDMKWLDFRQIAELIANQSIYDGYTLSSLMLAYSKKVIGPNPA